MRYTENPTVDFRKAETIETEDAAAFTVFIGAVPGETPVAWFSHKDEQAHPGVWVRRGMYRLKHGSFVDPSDLSCYAAQYYEPFASGRHECVQIGRTPETMAAPEGVTPAATAADLVAAICALAEVPESALALAAEAGEEARGASEAVGEAAEAVLAADGPDEGADATPAEDDAEAVAAAEGGSMADDVALAEDAAPAASALKLLQPDYAFEFHGALTRGWHAQLYTAESEDGTVRQLLVLR